MQSDVNFTASFREIHKNAWLKKISQGSTSKLLPASQKKVALERWWTVFCIHGDTEPFLEGYPDSAGAASAHTPRWRTPLIHTLHVSGSVGPARPHTEYEFVITLREGVIRLVAPTWESMQDWVDTLRNKLREMEILSPKENVYSKGPEQVKPRAPTRDPTSPLPPPPPGPVVHLPGVVPATRSIPENRTDDQNVRRAVQQSVDSIRTAGAGSSNDLENTQNERTAPNTPVDTPTSENMNPPEFVTSPGPSENGEVPGSSHTIFVSNGDDADFINTSTNDSETSFLSGMANVSGMNICLVDSVLEHRKAEANNEFFADFDEPQPESLAEPQPSTSNKILITNSDVNYSKVLLKIKPKTGIDSNAPTTSKPKVFPRTIILDNDKGVSIKKPLLKKEVVLVKSDERPPVPEKPKVTLVNSADDIASNVTIISVSNKHADETSHRNPGVEPVINVRKPIKHDYINIPLEDNKIVVGVTSNEVKRDEQLNANAYSNQPEVSNITIESVSNRFDAVSLDSNGKRNECKTYENAGNCISNIEVSDNNENRTSCLYESLFTPTTSSVTPEPSRSVTRPNPLLKSSSTSHCNDYEFLAWNENNPHRITERPSPSNQPSNIVIVESNEMNDNVAPTTNSETEKQTLVPKNPKHGLFTRGLTEFSIMSRFRNISYSQRSPLLETSQFYSDDDVEPLPGPSSAANHEKKNHFTEKLNHIFHKNENHSKPVNKFIERSMRAESSLRRNWSEHNDRTAPPVIKAIGNANARRPRERIERPVIKDDCQARRRSSSLSDNRTPDVPNNTDVASNENHTVMLRPMGLREQQVARLKGEMAHAGGVRLRLKNVDCLSDAMALADVYGTVWICGWKQRSHPLLYNVLHIGDRLATVRGVPITNVRQAKRALKETKPGLQYVELIIKRLPHGRVYTIKKESDNEDIGIVLDTATIIGVVPGSPAAKVGIIPKGTITEVNGRPLNLLIKKGDSQVRDRLNAIGKEVSILIQPTEFVNLLRASLRSVRGSKDYIVQ